MDAFGLKENSNYKFISLREIKLLFRIIEIVSILVFLSWAANSLPSAVKISVEYFRQFLAVMISPLFIFLLGNFITLTLFFKSKNLFSQKDEFETVLIEINDPYELYRETEPVVVSKPDEIVYEDKKTIFEGSKVEKVHKRSQSENFSKTEKSLLEVKHLRRSETEMRHRPEKGDLKVVDKLSNEEFQRAIEEFIAKQIKFHQEEKFAIVVPSS